MGCCHESVLLEAVGGLVVFDGSKSFTGRIKKKSMYRMLHIDLFFSILVWCEMLTLRNGKLSPVNVYCTCHVFMQLHWTLITIAHLGTEKNNGRQHIIPYQSQNIMK